MAVYLRLTCLLMFAGVTTPWTFMQLPTEAFNHCHQFRCLPLLLHWDVTCTSQDPTQWVPPLAPRLNSPTKPLVRLCHQREPFGIQSTWFGITTICPWCVASSFFSQSILASCHHQCKVFLKATLFFKRIWTLQVDFKGKNEFIETIKALWKLQYAICAT